MTNACIYDNPATLRRELWINLEVVEAIDLVTIACQQPAADLPDYFNIGEFVAGRKIGNKDAAVTYVVVGD